MICGFILPRLILESYGSNYNGLTTSITQFLSCAILLRAGIGGATRAALYKPLAEHDSWKINAIMSATNRFMKRVALILGIVILGFSCIYPFFVIDEFDWIFTFSLFLIIGISSFAESLFGITYIILLQADQRLYIASCVRILVYLLSTCISVVLLKTGYSIHVVKLGGALAYCIYPLGVNLYVRKRYHIDMTVLPDNESISQRWDAFWHQTANFVMNNTDTVVLTVFSNMAMVSIYSVYNLVINGLKKLIMTFMNGVEGAFGNMIAKDNGVILKENFYLIEFLMFCVSTIVNTCAWHLMLGFVAVYTHGIHDAEYIQPFFAAVIVSAHYFNCIRQPYQMIVQAAGHFAQTKKGAIIEPVLNITLSVILVVRFGLIGVAIGTLTATIFRTVQYAGYVHAHFIHDTMKRLLVGIAVSFIEFGATSLILSILSLPIPLSYIQWLFQAVVIVLISGTITLFFSWIVYRKELILLKAKLQKVLHMH